MPQRNVCEFGGAGEPVWLSKPCMSGQWPEMFCWSFQLRKPSNSPNMIDGWPFTALRIRVTVSKEPLGLWVRWRDISRLPWSVCLAIYHRAVVITPPLPPSCPHTGLPTNACFWSPHNSALVIRLLFASVRHVPWKVLCGWKNKFSCLYTIREGVKVKMHLEGEN